MADMAKLLKTWWHVVLALVICVAASLALLWHLHANERREDRLSTGGNSVLTKQPTEHPSVTTQVPSSRPPPRNLAAEPASRASVPETAKLFVAMNSATDLRVFAEAAKKEPGGYLYAIRAIDECRTLRDALLPAKPANAALNQAALDPTLRAQAEATVWLSRRCEGFTSAELSAVEQKFLVQTAKERDRLYALLAQAQSTATADSARREAALGDVLRSKDPTLIGAVTWSMAQLSPKGDSTVVFVDGRPFGGLDAAGFASAWSLAACSVAGTCAVRDSQVAHFCAFEGKCTQDIASLALADYQQADDIAKVRALAAQLEAIIASGDVQRLRPPRR
jgi:hypothetical protein